MLALPDVVEGRGNMAQNRLDRPAPRPAPSARKAMPAEEPGLDRGIQNHIGAKLRAMYDDLRDQPVPDRFLEILGNLDPNTSQGKKLDG
jgi:hypothetical protein